MQRLAILGCGTLGQSILGGVVAERPDQRGSLVVTARKQATLEALAAEHGVETTSDNVDAVSRSDVVLLCVKPMAAEQLVRSLAPHLEDKLLISVCAGVRTEQLDDWAPGAKLVRAMPNTPVRIGEGMTTIAAGPRATEEDLEHARELFEPVGRVLELDEKHLDVVTGLSGSGPAFAFVILEALADGGVMMGLPRHAAIELAAQTVQGAARLVLESGLHPAALKDEVTTPAGCTIAGLLTLEDGGIRSTLARAIQEATQVARGLGS